MSDVIKIRCSSLPRLALCPGSLRAAEGMSSPDTAQSEAGTAGHAALERYYMQPGHLLSRENEAIDPVDAFLDGLDDMIASRARWYVKTINGLIASHGGAKDIWTEVEMSAAIIEGVTLTGHADLIVQCADGIDLLIDYKFNWLEVPRASQNVQLMGYAWLWAAEHTVSNPIHAILTAGGNEEPFTAAEYNANALESAHKRLCEIAQDAVLLGAGRSVSDEACKYCPAKCSTRCPETLEEIADGENYLIHRADNLPESKGAVLDLWNKAAFLEKLIKDYKDRVKAAVMESPEEWAEQFKLQSTGSTRTITDAQAAYAVVVEEAGLLKGDEFFALVSCPIGKLEKALKEPLKESGVPVKDQKPLIEKMLGDNLESKPKSPSVKAVNNE